MSCGHVLSQLCGSDSELLDIWPLWPLAWVYYHCSSREAALRRLPQMRRDPEPWEYKGTFMCDAQRICHHQGSRGALQDLRCTWEVLCSCAGLLSGHWVKPSSLRSSSLGCSPSWWWRSESCSVCTRGCAVVPWRRASHSSCGTTLNTNTIKNIDTKADVYILNILLTGPHKLLK